MLGRIKSLGLILDRMTVLYERALVLLNRERECLVTLDFENLVSTLREKDEILSALKALDKDRLRIQDQFAVMWDMEPSDLSLKVLGESIQNLSSEFKSVGEDLLTKRFKLSSVIDDLRTKIELNQKFIEKSIDNIRGLAEHISATLSGSSPESGKKGGVYTGKAKYQESANRKGSLLRKRL